MNKDEFVSDLNVDPRIIGMPALLTPFLQQISSQRILMFGSNVTQITHVHGAETARIQTGYESKVGRYEFDSSSRDQDVQVLAVIPKFKLNAGKDQIRFNPTRTVIYQGCDDDKVGFFDVSSYTELHAGFGYINERMHQYHLMPESFINKDMKFQQAPVHEGDLYKLGVNANVCYLPMWDTTDDAFVISKSLAKKLEHTVIDSVILDVHQDDIPLNLYGDYDDYKCFPDIGETVREDGLLIGFRTLNKSSFLADLTQEALRTPEYIHDDLHRAPPGAQILDVQLYTNTKKYQKISGGIYSQMMRYQTQHYDYYAAIVDAYDKYRKEGKQMRPEFVNLVTRCKGLCIFRGGRVMTLMNKKEPVDFVNIKITWTYNRTVSSGFKLTGRDGAKGVVSARIWEDDDMPIGPSGVRSELIIAGESPFNRLNLGQNTEQFITCVGNHAQSTVINNPTWSNVEAYNYIMGVIHDIRPVFAKYIAAELNTTDKRDAFVASIKKDGFYFIIPPFTDSITLDMILHVADKYGIKHEPLTYKSIDENGERQTITTKYPGLIGSKYIYLLGKIPLDQLTAIEFGYVSQFMTPIKPKSKATKSQSVIGQTAIRFGEDEAAILTMSLGSEYVARMFGVYSNSTVALDKLQMQLLTAPKPTAIRSIDMTTREILDTSRNVAVFKHMLAAYGYQISKLGKEQLDATIQTI